MSRSESESFELARRCARVLDERKIDAIKIFDVSRSVQITDCFVIGTGLHPRHLRTACDKLVRELRQDGVRRLGLEGDHGSGWILVDFSDVVVHLFLKEQREFYDLELLWGDSPTIEWEPSSPPAASPPAASGR